MSEKKNNSLHDENGYSIEELYFSIKKHTKIILYIFISIFLLCIYLTLITKHVYKSTGIIMISEDQRSMSMLDFNLGANRNYIENEIQILKSRTTAELAINQLLTSEHKNNLYILKTRRYEPSKFRRYLTLGMLDRYQDLIDLNQDLDQNLIDKYILELSSSMVVNNQRNTDAITISVTSHSPQEAAILVNTIIDVYKKRDLEWATGEMNHLKVFLVDQLSQKEIELNDIEQKLKTFQESEKIFGLDENSALLLENLTQFETIYNNTLAEINIIKERENYLNTKLTSDEINLVDNVNSTINARLSALRSELIVKESELITTQTQYGDKHSAVEDLKLKINTLKDKLGNETKELIRSGISVADPILFRQALIDSMISIQSIKSALESKAISYKQIVDSYDKKLVNLPEKILQYTKLERVRSIHAETYSFMRRKLEEARIGEASKIGKIRLVDRATINQIPIKPNKKVNLMVGILLGLGFGFTVAVLIEYFDKTIKSIEQVERRGLSVLSIIPAIKKDNTNLKRRKRYNFKNKDIEKLQRRLITHEDPKSPISEAYRSLRTSLLYTSNNTKNKCQVILVSSSGPGEGKTTTIANLAITYANLGKKVLLVDSDLRKPVVHKVFKLDKTPGLTSFLSENNSNDKIIKNTDIDNLSVVTSGINPPNPSELLDSKKMEDFISINKKKFDIILFDSPPLIAVTDPYVLMKHVDQFIMVVRAGVTLKGAFNRAVTAIEQTDFKVSGIVMNAMTEEHSYGAGYYYNYYQYYHSDS